MRGVSRIVRLRRKRAISAAANAAVARGRQPRHEVNDFAGAPGAIKADPDRGLAQSQRFEVAASLCRKEIGAEDEEVGVAEMPVELIPAKITEVAEKVVHLDFRID